MARTSPEQNKALVLEAFDTLFNKRVERYWSDRYIQHGADIEPGRHGLFNLVRSLPVTLRYENRLILAEGDYIIAHSRFPGADERRPGSLPTSSASKTASSPSIGMCFRTKRRKSNRRAGSQCSAIASQIDSSLSLDEASS